MTDISPEELLAAELEEKQVFKGQVHIKDGIVFIGPKDDIPTPEELEKALKEAKEVADVQPKKK